MSTFYSDQIGRKSAVIASRSSKTVMSKPEKNANEDCVMCRQSTNFCALMQRMNLRGSVGVRKLTNIARSVTRRDSQAGP